MSSVSFAYLFAELTKIGGWENLEGLSLLGYLVYLDCLAFDITL